jgi:hypothetical protein
VTRAVERVAREHFLFPRIDIVVPSWTTRMVEIFELLAATESATHLVTTAQFHWLLDWNKAVEAFRSRNWDQALAKFQSIRKLRRPIRWPKFTSIAASNF